MTRRDWWTILCSALACGIIGPPLGALPLAIYGDLWDQPRNVVVEYPWWVAGRVPESIYKIVTSWIILASFGMLLFSLGGAILGGIGAWWLIRQRGHGVSANALRARGAVLGGLLGAICPGLLFIVPLAIALPLSLVSVFGLSPARWLHELLKLLDRSNLPYIVAYGLTGLGTGTILGWIVAFWLSRRPS